MAREVATKGIDGIGELVIMAPIKPGFIDAYENITFESRLRAVAEALFKIECNAREHEPFTPFADVAERILTVFNFRIGVLDRNLAEIKPTRSEDGVQSFDVEPQRTMFLIATYDGPFEPYLRLIWDPLGPFLDLLLCNCVGYKLSTDVGFPEYIAWVRDHLVESSIFYTTTANTLKDQLYLSDLERMQRERDPLVPGSDCDLKLAELTASSAQDKADAVWRDPTKLGEAVRLSFEALNVLFRLADFYPPKRTDADILLKASQDLLLGMAGRVQWLLSLPSGPPDSPIAKLQAVLRKLGVTHSQGGPFGPFSDHWDWFIRNIDKPAALPDQIAPPRIEIQRGLLNSYDEGFQLTHGLTLLYSVTDPELAGRSILLDMPLSWGDEDSYESEWAGETIKFYCTVAFTAPGLRKMELAPDDLARFPKEFREGMFQRAPMNGDIIDNHPRRWKFPPRFDASTGQDDPVRPAIHSDEIDVVVQLRISTRFEGESIDPDHIDFEKNSRRFLQGLAEIGKLDQFKEMASAGFKLTTAQVQGAFSPLGLTALHADQSESIDVIGKLFEEMRGTGWLAVMLATMIQRQSEDGMDATPGLRLLAIEPTFRPIGPYDGPLPFAPKVNRDHFGFVDGISQPKPAMLKPGAKPNGYDDKVPLGDILVGYGNSRGDTAEDQFWYEQEFPGNAPALLKDGSFMVLRKIAQFPKRLADLKKKYGNNGNPNEGLAHALVGRTAEGQPLHPDHASSVNSFTYVDDPKQAYTPFSSHIRLANPRDSFQGRPSPRILRRGMAYGPRYDPAVAGSENKPRGVLFIAYNASIADQYEVIQRWLNRGNATGVSSAANDPLTGVRQEVGSYTFRYIDGKTVKRAEMKEPLTELQWGLYAFVPSRSALGLICLPKKDPDHSQEKTEGLKTIERIEALPKREQQRAEWKRILEDFFVKDSADLGQMPPVWRAIREHHRGVYRIECGLPYGDGQLRVDAELPSDEAPVVLVADKQLILDVMANSRDFSSSERMRRTLKSIGKHYVAMDPVRKDGTVNPEYLRESLPTNTILYLASELRQKEIFDGAYTIATKVLDQYKANTSRSYFKIDFRREFLGNVLGVLCQKLFDIPDGTLDCPGHGHIDRGPWGWKEVDASGGTSPADEKRKPRCPADFMSPSRFSFYPRPATAVQDYGIAHGKALKAAALNLIDDRRPPNPLKPQGALAGQLSKMFAAAIPLDNDLLTRNILGSMTGAIPPLDANMRSILFDWIDQDSLWRQQTEYLQKKQAFDKGDSKYRSHFRCTEAALEKAIATAMCTRPAPDLLYRIATRPTTINGVTVNEGEMVILALISPMLASIDNPRNKPDLDPVFGGNRNKDFATIAAKLLATVEAGGGKNTDDLLWDGKTAMDWAAAGVLTHACPARSMVMAILYGMWAALFDAGRIVAQPASLILQITEWPGTPLPEPVTCDDLDALKFPNLADE